MACIQPSFLHFYLFRTQQNTSSLITSKDVLKYPGGGSFLNNPNFYPFGQQHFPLKNNSKPSPQIFRYIQRDRQDFVHILPTLPSRLKFQTSFQGDHSQFRQATNQSVLQYHKILKSSLRGIHKISSTTRFSNFLDPSLGETFAKPGMATTSTQNIDPIPGRLHKTLPISTTFPNIEPVPQP